MPRCPNGDGMYHAHQLSYNCTTGAWLMGVMLPVPLSTITDFPGSDKHPCLKHSYEWCPHGRGIASKPILRQTTYHMIIHMVENTNLKLLLKQDRSSTALYEPNGCICVANAGRLAVEMCVKKQNQNS